MRDLGALLENPVGDLTGKPGVILPSGHVLHNPAQRKVRDAATQSAELVKGATDAAEKWKNHTLNPSRDPTEAAKDAESKWENNTKKAIDEKRFRKGLNKVDKAATTATIEKLGSGVFSAGIEARKTKIDKVFSELQPLQQSLSNAIQAMPQGTDSEREARLLAARRGAIEIGKKRRG